LWALRKGGGEDTLRERKFSEVFLEQQVIHFKRKAAQLGLEIIEVAAAA
jgi:hypothetical protein